MSAAKKNPAAFALRSKLFSGKAVSSKKVYDRRSFKKGE